VQGSKLAIADSADFVNILMNHAKMPSLRRAAGDTHVEVHSGGAAVIARAVQAAINPTEGQRMLQAGFHGAILGGESRKRPPRPFTLMALSESTVSWNTLW